MKRLLAAALLLASALACAAGSSVNPAVPATNAPLVSAIIRNNFAAAYSDINALIQQNASVTAPSTPPLGQLWLNTTATPYVLNEWDGTNWVARGTLNATTHTWISALANSALLPVQTIAGTSHVFVTGDLYQKTRRSNTGTSMTDTLMASTGLLNGAQVNIANSDATASDTVTAGAGTTIDGSSTFVITPGRDIWWTYDLANTQWRAVANTKTALLGPNNLSDVSSAATARTNLGVGPAALTGTTVSVGGSALLAGACSSGTVTIAGVDTTMAIAATPTTYPGDGNYWIAYVSSSNNVTVKVCAAVAGTPTTSTYIVRAIP